MRLFVAIDLPDRVKDQLGTLPTRLPTARWVSRQQMHVTLFFLGETDRVENIKAALSGVKAPPFALNLTGVGRFPTRRKQPPRVLWVGIDPEPALQALHQQVTATLSELDFAPEDRPFSPHVTLARLKTRDPLPEVDVFLSAHETFRVPRVPITEFVLFSSELSPQGAHYQREAVYALQAI